MTTVTNPVYEQLFQLTEVTVYLPENRTKNLSDCGIIRIRIFPFYIFLNILRYNIWPKVDDLSYVVVPQSQKHRVILNVFVYYRISLHLVPAWIGPSMTMPHNHSKHHEDIVFQVEIWVFCTEPSSTPLNTHVMNCNDDCTPGFVSQHHCLISLMLFWLDEQILTATF